jgi:hypothetical protein
LEPQLFHIIKVINALVTCHCMGTRCELIGEKHRGHTLGLHYDTQMLFYFVMDNPKAYDAIDV